MNDDKTIKCDGFFCTLKPKRKIILNKDKRRFIRLCYVDYFIFRLKRLLPDLNRRIFGWKSKYIYQVIKYKKKYKESE